VREGRHLLQVCVLESDTLDGTEYAIAAPCELIHSLFLERTVQYCEDYSVLGFRTQIRL
jgi:hypothetical protein